MNGAFLDPKKRLLVVTANIADLSVTHTDDCVTIWVENLDDGIEVVSEDDRLWWPA